MHTKMKSRLWPETGVYVSTLYDVKERKMEITLAIHQKMQPRCKLRMPQTEKDKNGNEIKIKEQILVKIPSKIK